MSGHHRRLGTPATNLNTHFRSRWASEAVQHKSVEGKAPCCETYPLDVGSREDDTPAHIKRFLHEIAPEEADSDTVHDHLFQRSLNRAHLHERIRMADAAPAHTGRSSRRGSLANPDIQKIDEESEESSAAPPVVQQMHKFTEMEIVTLWNRFKFDFPTGNINGKQLLQLFRQVKISNS